MLFKPALNYFYLFFDRSYSEKTAVFFSRLQVKGDGWSPLQPLGASKEVSKSKRTEMALISQSLTGADTANKALLLHVHVHLTVPSQVLIPF